MTVARRRVPIVEVGAARVWLHNCDCELGARKGRGVAAGGPRGDMGAMGSIWSFVLPGVFGSPAELGGGCRTAATHHCRDAAPAAPPAALRPPSCGIE